MGIVQTISEADVAQGTSGPLVVDALRASQIAGDTALMDDWDRLARAAATPNPFFESWYLLPALTHIRGARDVVVLTVRHYGRLIGLLPVQPQLRYDRFLLPHWRIWVHENCFCGLPLVARGLEDLFWRGALDWCDANAGQRLFLHLSQIPLDTPVIAALRRTALSNRRVSVVREEQRALLHSTLSPQAYFEAAMTQKKRKELRRQKRRLEESGTLAFQRDSDDRGLSDWIAQFLALEAAGWKGKGDSALASQEDTQALFRAALSGAAERGLLERLTLTLDQRPVAMLANFITAPGAYSYKTTYDEDLARFSPGVLLQIENLDLLARGDIEWCDSCATPDHPMIDRIWKERLAVGRISVGIGGSLRRAAFRQIVAREKSRPL